MTAAQIEAAFNSIPTVNLVEVTRIVTPAGTFGAEVLFRWANGTIQVAYTDAAGVVRIVRTKG